MQHNTWSLQPWHEPQRIPEAWYDMTIPRSFRTEIILLVFAKPLSPGVVWMLGQWVNFQRAGRYVNCLHVNWLSYWLLITWSVSQQQTLPRKRGSLVRGHLDQQFILNTRFHHYQFFFHSIDFLKHWISMNLTSILCLKFQSVCFSSVCRSYMIGCWSNLFPFFKADKNPFSPCFEAAKLVSVARSEASKRRRCEKMCERGSCGFLLFWLLVVECCGMLWSKWQHMEEMSLSAIGIFLFASFCMLVRRVFVVARVLISPYL